MPVLAHPCLYKKNNIEDLIKLGIKGIEAVYPRKENRETSFTSEELEEIFSE